MTPAYFLVWPRRNVGEYSHCVGRWTCDPNVDIPVKALSPLSSDTLRCRIARCSVLCFAPPSIISCLIHLKIRKTKECTARASIAFVLDCGSGGGGFLGIWKTLSLVKIPSNEVDFERPLIQILKLSFSTLYLINDIAKKTKIKVNSHQ